jgi:CrcB protein
MIYLVVGLAGIIGTLLRYYMGMVVDFWWLGYFPLGTLLVNLIGCFALGWFTTRISKIEAIHPYILTALGTGLMGSFTTFSTFSVETVVLLQSSRWVTALLYVLLSLWGGLLMGWLGYKVGDYLFQSSQREVEQS